MKGVILAGGSGSRLKPLTDVTNKALLPMGRRPMINHVMDVLLKAGITEIMIVTSSEHMGAVVSLLGSGQAFGCELTYRVQEESNGIAAALALCEDFVGDDRFAVILGDNIFERPEEVAVSVRHFASDDFNDCYLFIKTVPDPQRFGVVKHSPRSRGKAMAESIIRAESIVEKPTDPPSNDAVLGLYCYTSDVFNTVRNLRRLGPSARGEYEISDVNNELVKGPHLLKRVESGWIDAGTHESYERANDMLRGKGT